MVTRHCAQRDDPFIFTSGMQVSHVEVDTDTGLVRLLKPWAVEDCGRVVNPMLVDEQMPDTIVSHVQSPTRSAMLGTQGAGQFAADHTREVPARAGQDRLMLPWCASTGLGA